MDGGKGKKGSSRISLQQFITTMMPLIDMEKEAEIAASLDSGSSVPVATAKKRNSMFFNLKCTDVQTGLMGKTLLASEPNKGEVLHAHKFGPHDVVVLRQNKAEAGSASLGQGVVYRLKDSSITVAFDDIPEDGLNVPLRLEKVANESSSAKTKNCFRRRSRELPGINESRFEWIYFRRPIFIGGRRKTHKLCK